MSSGFRKSPPAGRNLLSLGWQPQVWETPKNPQAPQGWCIFRGLPTWGCHPRLSKFRPAGGGLYGSTPLLLSNTQGPSSQRTSWNRSMSQNRIGRASSGSVSRFPR